MRVCSGLRAKKAAVEVASGNLVCVEIHTIGCEGEAIQQWKGASSGVDLRALVSGEDVGSVGGVGISWGGRDWARPETGNVGHGSVTDEEGAEVGNTVLV